MSGAGPLPGPTTAPGVKAGGDGGDVTGGGPTGKAEPAGGGAAVYCTGCTPLRNSWFDGGATAES